MRSRLAVRSLTLAAATFAAALGFTPAAAEAQTAAAGARVAAARSSVPSARALTAEPRIGQCAYHPRTDRMLGRVVALGPMNLDAGRRPATGQRRVQVELKNGIDIGVTYPRNLRVRNCR